MATITTNLETLALKQLLEGATLPLPSGTIIVADFEKDKTGNYEIEDTVGNLHIVDGYFRGTATATGASKPSPKNGGTRKKVTKLDLI